MSVEVDLAGVDHREGLPLPPQIPGDQDLAHRQVLHPETGAGHQSDPSPEELRDRSSSLYDGHAGNAEHRVAGIERSHCFEVSRVVGAFPDEADICDGCALRGESFAVH